MIISLTSHELEFIHSLRVGSLRSQLMQERLWFIRKRLEIDLKKILPPAIAIFSVKKKWFMWYATILIHLQFASVSRHDLGANG